VFRQTIQKNKIFLYIQREITHHVLQNPAT
jgi:hypothetical protein